MAAQADDESTAALLARAWPVPRSASIAETGRGIGIVFSPDISVRNNCRFYESLGFACFDSPDWNVVLERIRIYNDRHTEHPIRTLILETHGTNGHGLKLQDGKEPLDDRSYISVGGLQERLELLGVETVVLSACNSGRLLRPKIYRTLDPNPGDKLFLPPHCGILDASKGFRPEASKVVVITPASSRIETTLVGSVSELGPEVRKVLGRNAPKQFAISDLMIQMMTRDPRLKLQRGRYVETFSDEIAPPSMSERLFDRFVAHLDTLVARWSAPLFSNVTRH